MWLRAFALSAATLMVAGCASGGSGLSRTVRSSRAAMRTTTYQVVGEELGADGDGYTFLNPRFRFEFAKGFDAIDGYRTPSERHTRGKAASGVLNDSYDFVRDIFGIEAAGPIHVAIAIDIEGNPHDANTRIQWQMLGEQHVEGTEKVTMTFGKEAFETPSTLAHELTHALLGVYALPAWLDEGIATMVQIDHAEGVRHNSTANSLVPIGLDEQGYNVLQNWRGDASPLPFRSAETYGAAYTIVAEIQKRFGADVFAKLFRDFQRTKPHLQGKRLSTAQIIAGLNRVTNADTHPFFHEIRFRTEDAN